MSADVAVLWGAMSQVESPFHAIAAQALDDTHTHDVESNAGAGTVGASCGDAAGQERQEERVDSLLNVPATDGLVENGGNEEAAEKVVRMEDEVEEAARIREELKASLGVASEGGGDVLGDTVTKKSKKRTNVWTKTTSRKSAKKSSVKNNGARPSDSKDDHVLLKPFHQEDNPTYPILLSRTYKAEKIELSADRLSASGSKGYRMVRATRGVVEGAWYFEIYVERLADTGHTRLGWSTRRGDIQAPVGYDAHSYAYRDVDGSKVHAALRQEYGQAYFEKDVIGFYINLPREEGFTRKAEEEVFAYKGQPYTIVADEPLKAVPGSEILFFKNGVRQGVAFRDINDGSYFPAASMYTHPSQDCCRVVFNFGPDFKYPVTDLGDRPFPSPMCQVSGPGEARADVVPTTQVEGVVVVASADNMGGKQRMVAPDHANSGDTEEATTPKKAEIAPKAVGKVPVIKKKEKMPKDLVGTNTQTLPKKPKAGESRLNPGLKREVNPKGAQNGTTGGGLGPTDIMSQKGSNKGNSTQVLGSTGLPVQKGAKKGTTGEGLGLLPGLPNQQVGKKDGEGFGSVGLPSPKGPKKNITRVGPGSLVLSNQKAGKKETTGVEVGSLVFANQKGGKKETPGTRLLNASKEKSVPGLLTFKGTKKDISDTGVVIPKGIKKNMTGVGSLALKGNKDMTGVDLQSPRGGSNRDLTMPSLQSKKDITGSGVPVHQGSKKAVTGTGSSGHQGSKRDIAVAGLHSGKGSKKDTLGAGLPNPKRIKKDVTATGSAMKASQKDMTGMGSAFKVGKKDMTGIQSAHKATKKDLTGTGFPSAGLESAVLSGRRTWGEGIQGAMDVDVVVVESSAPY